MTGPVWRRPLVAPVYAAALAFAVVAGVSLVAPKVEGPPASTQTPETSETSHAPPSGPTRAARPPAAPTKEAPPPSSERPSGGATAGADSGGDHP
jgi:hypothetical protein